MNDSEHDDAAGLADPGYLRERLHPHPKDHFYLHLSDLLMALRGHSSEEEMNILDFGCGGSPYRSLFPNATYRRADLKGGTDLDYWVDAQGRTDAPDAEFDLVLSTQVLEHCVTPEIYLQECKRVLKKGGKLLLTTHGLFEEHGCPFDFHRWTEDGLRKTIASTGFKVSSVSRLTLGPRAGLLIAQRSVERVVLEGYPLLVRLGWRIASRVLLSRGRIWNPLADYLFPAYRVAEGKSMPGGAFYIALLAAAEAI